MKSDNELVCTLGAKEYAQYTIACAAPDPFVFSFGKAGSISFFKDGRVTSDLENADDAARNLLTLVEQYYREHILEAERRAEQRVRAEIGRDSERLDWLAGTVQEISRVSNRPTQWVLEFPTPLRSLDRDDLRHAIDAAREVG